MKNSIWKHYASLSALVIFLVITSLLANGCNNSRPDPSETTALSELSTQESQVTQTETALSDENVPVQTTRDENSIENDSSDHTTDSSETLPVSAATEAQSEAPAMDTQAPTVDTQTPTVDTDSPTVNTEAPETNAPVIMPEAAPVLNPSEPITKEGTFRVNVGQGKAYAVAFSPSDTGYWSFFSQNSGDTFASLYDTDWHMIASDDNTYDGKNFAIEAQLTAGQTYYLMFKWASPANEGNIDVTFKQGRLDAETTAETDAETVPETTAETMAETMAETTMEIMTEAPVETLPPIVEDPDPMDEICDIIHDTVITDTTAFTIHVSNQEKYGIVLAPTESGTWILTSNSTGDARATLYDITDSPFRVVAENDDSDMDLDFSITYALTAGRRYALVVSWVGSAYTTSMPLKFTTGQLPYHSSVDHVNGKGPNGSEYFTDRGGNWLDGIDYMDAATHGISVNADATISIGGWCAVDGGTYQYVYSINGEEWYKAIGGYTGEPLNNYYQSQFGFTNATINGMFHNNYGGLVADLSRWAGQTVDVIFAAEPLAGSSDVCPIICIQGLTVPGNTSGDDEDETQGSDPTPDDPDKPTVSLTIDPRTLPYGSISGDITTIINATGSEYSPMVAAAGLPSAALLHQGSIHLGNIDLSQYSRVVITYASDWGEATQYDHAADVAQGYGKIYLVDQNYCRPNKYTNQLHVTPSIVVAESGSYKPDGMWTLTNHEIDLTDISYSGDVYLTCDFLHGQIILIDSITFYP